MNNCWFVEVFVKNKWIDVSEWEGSMFKGTMMAYKIKKTATQDKKNNEELDSNMKFRVAGFERVKK